ncbi:MAG: type I methionyl aminopeptidase, partial [Deltaproteobacteria bacterium]|nr:type I methionyl aminopeptidase [Deltaproteobacteria bacterium]
MIVLKSPYEIEKMRKSNLAVAEVIAVIRDAARPGVATIELERLCDAELKKRKVRPAFKGYRGYPYCICASVNEEVVHGMPSNRVLREGDILSVDVGAECDGYYGDAAVTIPLGRISEEASRLIDVTETALSRAIEKACVGNRLFDISYAVQSYVEENGFSVVRVFVGHGIGRELHEAPQVPNFGTPGSGIRLKAGMVFAIEPMINAGGSDIVVLDDGWTAVTKDGSLSAHFEHTVAVTEKGPYILSKL